MSSIYFEPNSKRSYTDAPPHPQLAPVSDIAPLAVPAMVLGVLMLCLGAVGLTRIGGWIGDFGPVLVFLAGGLYVSAAAGLVLWGLFVRRGQ
ncbi:hypothetical protein ACWEVD_26550 [Nocardia thailandica]|uniref:Uncharacterized protein n=1 Tax=Nocardia thailandica TaxID=257275 RepID=A0ABW6PX00_9NOCA|nr:hypothetical protein [Nocardia thailandica]